MSIYNTATVCLNHPPFTCGLRLQPDLTNIMAASRNWHLLQHVWSEWRRHTGHNMKNAYEQLVMLSNEAAKLNSKQNNQKFQEYSFLFVQIILIQRNTGISLLNLQISMKKLKRYGLKFVRCMSYCMRTYVDDLENFMVRKGSVVKCHFLRIFWGICGRNPGRIFSIFPSRIRGGNF